MARRPDGDGRFTLSQRGRLIAGWLAAIVLVIGIAAVVRILGGNGDGAPIGAGPSGSAVSGAAAEISFGTAIDTGTAQVAADSRVETFAAGETFAYSVAPSGTVPDAVYVEVISAETDEVAQAPVSAQDLPDPRAIAFTVPVDDLLAVFGAGEFVMRIYADPSGEPLAEGSFELVAAGGSPSASP